MSRAIYLIGKKAIEMPIAAITQIKSTNNMVESA
jgi:hypothetical protein